MTSSMHTRSLIKLAKQAMDALTAAWWKNGVTGFYDEVLESFELRILVYSQKPVEPCKAGRS